MSSSATKPPKEKSPIGFFVGFIDRFCFGVLKLLVGVSFIAMIVSVFCSVALRELGYNVFPWMEEASGYLVVWSVFLSSAVLARRHEHISVDIFYEHVSAKTRMVINVLIAMLGVVMVGYLAYMGWSFTYVAFQFGDVSLSGYIPVWLGYAAIPLGLGLTALAYLVWLVELVRKGPDSAQGDGEGDMSQGEPSW